MSTVISLDSSLRVINPEGELEKVRILDLHNKVIVTDDLSQFRFDQVRLINLVDKEDEEDE